MKAHKFLVAPLSALALAITLTACGGGSDSTSKASDESLVTNEEVKPQATGGFDSPVVTPAKVSYTLSSPSHFCSRKICIRNASGQSQSAF